MRILQSTAATSITNINLALQNCMMVSNGYSIPCSLKLK